MIVLPSAIRRKLTPYIPLLAYVVFACFVALATFQAFHKIENLIEFEKIDDLGSIADLKVGQIVSWQEGHLKQAATFSNSGFLAPEFEGWLQQGGHSGEREHGFLRELSGLQLTQGYASASLLDRQARVRITTGNTNMLDGGDVKLALAAMNSRKPLLSDFHKKGNGSQAVTISLAAPLIVSNEKSGLVVGAVLLHIDPNDFLYPLIQSWPGPSPSAETLLARRDGDEVLFLNELRHRKGAALSLRIPVKMMNLPTAMGIRGETGTKGGVDYRGVPVVAAMRQVPGTAWFMVAKVDKDEIFSPIKQIKEVAASLGFAFAIFGGFFFFVWLQGIHARQRQLKAQHDAALERELLLKHFEYLTRYANDMIIVANEMGEIVEANERAQQALGYSREELLQKRILDLYAPHVRPKIPDEYEKLRRDGALIIEGVYQRKDGSTFPVETSARMIEVSGARYLQGIARDITERKLSERWIHRLNNFYLAISRANEAIVLIKDRDRLFQEICRIAVKYGQFKLAWIGLVDDETRTLKVAAFSGEASEYLDGIQVAIDADKPEGYGPTGKSVRDDRESICNDFINDPSTRPWHENAKKHGLLANASYPLRLEGRAVGALSLYADEANYFDLNLVNLLSDLARDISLALDNFAREDRRRKIERMLQASEEHFRFLAENSTDMLYRMSLPDGRYEYVSPASVKLCGYAPEEFYRAPLLIRRLIHPDWHAYFEAQWAKLVAGEILPIYEFQIIHKSGETRWMQQRNSPILDGSGALIAIQGVVIDITEHKLLELMRAKMEHAGRLNVAAEMASGLAHELSQPLSACNNYLDGCLRRMDANDWDREKLHMAVQLAHKQADRAGKIINHLKNLVRKQGHERTLIDINLLVREVMDHLEDDIKRSGISVTMTLFPVPPVMACRVEIEQVLFNLYKNAIEAMHSCPQRELRAITSHAAESGMVMVTISDSGRGISPSEMAGIFNPYQTSKQEGLGLGLAICRTSIENHGGRIWVDAQREFGAEFYFTLPVGDVPE